MADLKARHGGVWKSPTSLKAKDGGVWKDVVTAYAKDNGVWKEVYALVTDFTATITTNQSNFNLRTWALANGWDGTSAATITVGVGVEITSTSTAIAALTIDGGWRAA